LSPHFTCNFGGVVRFKGCLVHGLSGMDEDGEVFWVRGGEVEGRGMETTTSHHRAAPSQLSTMGEYLGGPATPSPDQLESYPDLIMAVACSFGGIYPSLEVMSSCNKMILAAKLPRAVVVFHHRHLNVST